MKLIAILLFTFELLAPAAFATTEVANEGRNEYNAFTPHAQSLDLLSHLIFEEMSNEEEREGKEHSFTTLFFTEVFSILQKFEPTPFTRLSPSEKFNTHPSLFTLHRVLLI